SAATLPDPALTCDNELEQHHAALLRDAPAHQSEQAGAAGAGTRREPVAGIRTNSRAEASTTAAVAVQAVPTPACAARPASVRLASTPPGCREIEETEVTVVRSAAEPSRWVISRHSRPATPAPANSVT